MLKEGIENLKKDKDKHNKILDKLIKDTKNKTKDLKAKISEVGNRRSNIRESFAELNNVNYRGSWKGTTASSKITAETKKVGGSYTKGKKIDYTKTDFSSMSLKELTIKRPPQPKKPNLTKPSNYKAKENITAKNPTGKWTDPTEQEIGAAWAEFKIDKKVYRDWHRANEKATSNRDTKLIQRVLVKLKTMKDTNINEEIKFVESKFGRDKQTSKKIDSANKNRFKDISEINQILYLLKDSEELKPIVGRIKTLLSGNKTIKPTRLTAKEKKDGKKAELTQEQKARKQGLTTLISTDKYSSADKNIEKATIEKFEYLAKEAQEIIKPTISFDNKWDASRIKMLLGKPTSRTSQVLFAIANNGKTPSKEAYSYQWNGKEQTFMSKTVKTETYGTEGETVVEAYYNNSYSNFNKLEDAIISINKAFNDKLEGMDDSLLDHLLNQDAKNKEQNKQIKDLKAFIKSKKNLVNFFKEQKRMFDELTKPKRTKHLEDNLNSPSLPKQWVNMFDFIEESVELTKDTTDTKEELLAVKKYKYSMVIDSLKTFIEEVEEWGKEQFDDERVNELNEERNILRSKYDKIRNPKKTKTSKKLTPEQKEALKLKEEKALKLRLEKFKEELAIIRDELVSLQKEREITMSPSLVNNEIKELVKEMQANISEFSEKFNEDLEGDLDIVEELQLEQGSAEANKGQAKTDGGK